MHFLDNFSQQNVEKKTTFVVNNTTNSLLCDVYGHYFFQSFYIQSAWETNDYQSWRRIIHITHTERERERERERVYLSRDAKDYVLLSLGCDIIVKENYVGEELKQHESYWTDWEDDLYVRLFPFFLASTLIKLPVVCCCAMLFLFGCLTGRFVRSFRLLERKGDASYRYVDKQMKIIKRRSVFLLVCLSLSLVVSNQSFPSPLLLLLWYCRGYQKTE